MLRTEDWAAVLRAKAARAPAVFEFLGGKGDRETVREIVAALGPEAETRSLAGELSLPDTVRRLAEMDELVCIDSALLHFGRLIGTPISAYFGPTDPRILLRPMEPGLDDLHYLRISCSPCVHLAARAPCHGDNLCMRHAAGSAPPGSSNPVWLAQYAVPADGGQRKGCV
jgi:ADP-heptose:LPS heptosyltransferase